MRDRIGWAAAWGAVLLLALWMSRLTSGWYLGAAVCALLWLVLPRVSRIERALVFAALAVALGLAGRTQFRLWRVASDWNRVRPAVEERAGERVNDGLNNLFDRGGQAVLGAADAAGGARVASTGLFQAMERVRAQTGMSAVAIYRADGSPLVWAGEHRGTVPDSVRRGLVESSFSAGPLFGYVYFTEPLQTGNVAIAAKLLQAHVRMGEGATPYAERFAERNGIVPRFTTPALAQGDSVWDWATSRDTILSGVFETLTQDAWRDRVVDRGRWEVSLAWAAGALLLALVWWRGGGRNPGVPVAVLTVALVVAPLGALVHAAELFSPTRFVLPLPVDVTLGQLLVVLSGAAVWMLARQTAGRRTGRLPLPVRVAMAGGWMALVLWTVRSSVAAAVLASREGGGAPVVLAMSLLAALPLYALLGRRDGDERVRGEAVAGSLIAAALLAACVIGWWRPGRELPVWSAAAWAIPFALAAYGIPRVDVRRGALLPWVCAGWIAASLALPALWTLHLTERLGESERELGKLGTQADPFLDFLLRQFSEDVLRLDAEGRQGVSLLYQAWVEAGLAREGYEGRITVWSGGEPATELRLADAAVPRERVAALLQRARLDEEPRLERMTDVPGLHYLLVVPLTGGQSVSVAVPPRAYLSRSTSLARFLDPQAAGEGDDGATLSLVPARGLAEGTGDIRWLRAENGWRSETTVLFPGQPMHAHMLLLTPTRAILGARGIVSAALLLAAMTLLWALGRTLCGEPLGVEPARWAWIFTFRGRLTGALFAFFLLPMAAFGATAYQALSREVERTAGALADRALTQASAEVNGQGLSALSSHVGADLLLYQRGVLRQAASPEVIDLGLYDAWLPPAVYLDFTVGEAVEREERRELAGREYLVAYRGVEGGRVLASPTPLATGEIARRRRELADLVALAGLAGAALSLVLSLLVGRTLSRPIEALSGAAASVGSGDLSVRLPSGRRDEFGRVYRAFNRMVRSLRLSQAALVRETRRTEAIVAEAGTGVVALDAAGRVALINPRAEQILGVDIPVGAAIPGDLALPGVVAATVSDFLASGARERVEEREVDGRVVRLRLRGLSVDTVKRGAVLVLEDVTNEIRSARVLAWGEMARQVAHEIKNPLTPIKLAVQHVRRAYADGRDDFGGILDRNVEAVLREIDHLGEISRAFARFGTPAEAGAPLETVDVRRVSEETLALYRGGSDGIDYGLDLEPGLPPVRARAGELKEVLVNLLENARGALDGPGEVRITAAQAGGGAWVQVDVADNGEGIPAESLPRVFEPQFSTKTSGTGLGLAIVRRLVEAWGGEVTVDSTPGEGTTVHLRLPVAPA
ncbi:ATP-binding protein [Longimicrobium terrae]|uniref:histidine kinase n=1 Tax=Longimicrobium terrae TaxID=1639882 RepID=A0A841GU44_9BACT|nr:ATP-binding protein [Longimicrobium terrae]MBB4635823.1 signal transduction histidine kinase [Longimicrobium terrae]MBB6070219.1 signal transduction histidine kinase [Longimicrobium terrae]NNC30725.1 HAMP domain-containing protein [Longimicrobium terrae]